MMFDSLSYYLAMSIVGWLLVAIQVTIAVWLYKNLRVNK
jgi:hypothetical protein